MSSKNLFDEFSAVTKKQWLERIEKDLRGKGLESLQSQMEDDIVINPVYNNEDVEFATHSFRSSKDWQIVQEIFVSNEKEANKQALEALEKGATSLLFYSLPNADLNLLLEKILIEHIHTHFVSEGNGVDIAKKLKKIISERGLTENEVKGSINIDALENLARTGNWFKNEEEDFNELKDLIPARPVGFRTLCINANLFANAGATFSQQNAIALSMAYEYIHRMEVKNTSLFWFNFAVGSDYFGEIAKLRAFRKIWQQLQNELKLDINPAHIYAENTLRNKSIADSYNNMIRSTSECMSAVIGGCDEFSNKSFDMPMGEKSSFGQRIARNQQIILQSESHLNAVRDISEGSYFIESITESIARKSWEFFKEIEENGGYLKCLKSGWLQEQIDKAAEKEMNDFDTKKRVLIGVNKHPLTKDLKAKDEKRILKKDLQLKNTVIPVKVSRLSEQIE